LLVIDQRALPHKLSWLRITTVDELIDAIRTLAIRGAPALGVSGAFGVALAASAHAGDTEKVTLEAARIASARPTAANLAWGVRRALAKLPAGPEAVLAEAEEMLAEDARVNRVCATHATPVGWPPQHSVPLSARCECCTPAARSPTCWSTRRDRCCKGPG
jgi:methylthioribose-1-phosphate isomerase